MKRFLILARVLLGVICFLQLNFSYSNNWCTSRKAELKVFQTGDTQAPSAISNLSASVISSSILQLSWSAPGDDGFVGTASSYEIRYSTTPINSSNFANGTLASGIPTPLVRGTSQNLIISNLLGNTTYYFAIISRDEANNTSSISNVVSRTTPSDNTDPDEIEDLAVTQLSSSSVSLTWTAPGDDNSVGTATSYEIRYSNGTIYNSNFASATLVPNIPAPAVAGTSQSMIVSGLSANTRYYFAIVTKDEVPNASFISNVVNISIYVDVFPPSAITNLSSLTESSSQISLEWSSPGDDAKVGTASSYEVRYNTVPITPSNFSVSTLASGIPSPLISGTRQSLVINNLAQNTVYYFAMVSIDDALNVSALSNVVSENTLIDNDKPSNITNLAVIPNVPSSVTLSWTAPGDDGNTGTATSYEIRYSTSSITNSNFATATLAPNAPFPAAAGTSQSMTITGLVANTRYYFAIVAKDEVQNASYISNVINTTIYVDVFPPSTITNLNASSNSSSEARLSWTAPGDDGTTGTATSYEIRYSTAPITSSNFSSATLASGIPTPLTPGTGQSITIGNLSQNTTYYFSIITKDEIPNASAISTIVSTTTEADISRPSIISNLTATRASSSTINLSWSSPGDDGSTGTATSYEIRYSTSSISSSNFASATLATGIPLPAVAGTTQSLTIKGLPQNTTYYFAIQSKDEVPNTSSLSNIVNATTLADAVAPGTITNLSAALTSNSTANLTWTAPGDDGTTGTAATYEIRYSTTAITAANFASATLATGIPLPGAPGTTQSVVVGGLAQSTTYYFAIITKDEKPNASAISNVASVTVTDIQAPAAITNLAATSPSSSSISLTWTAPGDDATVGTAKTYEIRYSTAAITAANFSSATLATGIPVPAIAGTNQSMSIAGLLQNTTYYIAIVAKDEVPNTSSISNLPSIKTLADVAAPSIITNLTATTLSTSSIRLNWTAPGDDAATGTAKTYDIRFSTIAITAANFATATLATGIPVPAIAGTVQTLTLTGLAANTTYYFAIIAKDEVPNSSAISNLPAARTDVQAPSAITNLAATTLTANSVRLNWTSPGDDGAVGTASTYDIRYSTTAITAGNFSTATSATGIPAPAIAGSAQTLTLSGLTANTTYYFAIITKDEVPLSSAISNIASARTDVVAPAAITTLTATALTPGSIRLNWTSSGDDGATGTATSYDIRVSPTAITAANFSAAPVVSGAPAPLISGTSQTVTATGLTANTTYYFALIAKDEVPNSSSISNVISAKTPAAVAPVANAGVYRSVTLLNSSILIEGSATVAAGTIDAYLWTKQSGPAATLTGHTTNSLTVTGLNAGTYVFRLTATASGGATAYDEMTLTVSAAPTAGVPRTFKYTPNYNGNISAIKWNSKYGTQAKAEKIYAYQYDTLNRLKNAYYAEKTGTTFTQAVGHYNEEGITYDRNGNILKLKRFESFNVGKRVMDSLNYRYVGNQLIGVNDAIPAYDNYDNGFTDKITNTTNPDYVYDGNGNMIEDKHKGIKIFYNYLNLPDSIHFGNNNYILYDYNATGQKLAKRVFTNNTLTKNTYYDGEYVFEDNQLEFISTEEGRVIPSTKPGQAGQYEYEYFLKDHLGNTRLVINSASPNKYEYLATMESEVASVKQQEESEFTNITQTRETDAANNHTTGGNETAKLNATQGKIIGPGISLKVTPGDTIKMEVWAKFGHVPTADYTQVVGTIASAAAGAYTGGLTEAQRQTVSNAFAGVPRLPLTNTVAPRAYLNYIFFDKSYRYDGSKSGFVQVSSTAATAFEKLALQKIIEQEGYLYIYVANESSANVDVFFDDLKVTQVETPVRSHTDYYPFGLTIAGLSGESAGTNLNKFKYNGKELQDDAFGGISLGMYDYGARFYDPTLGRFSSIDSKADVYHIQSPYAYAANNPINYIDKNGEGPEPLTSAGLKTLASSFGIRGNKRIGEFFERAAIMSISTPLTVRNTTNYYSEERAFRNGGKGPSSVRPDLIGLTKKIEGVAKITADPNSFYEVKATGANLTRSYRKGQLEGMVDVLAGNAEKNSTGKAVLTLVTTSDAKVGQDLLDYATDKEVSVYQITAAIDSDGNIVFSSPERLNDVGEEMSHIVEDVLNAIDLDKYDSYRLVNPKNVKTNDISDPTDPDPEELE